MTYRHKSNAWLVLFLPLLLSPSAILIAQKDSLHQTRVVEALVLWNRDASGVDSIDQESYAATARTIGFWPVKVSTRDLDTVQLGEQNLLLVPSASGKTLSSKQARQVVEAVKRGLKLIVGGEGPLLSAVNVKLGEPEKVNTLIDQGLPENLLHWADRPRVPWIAEHAGASMKTVYADSATGHPLVAAGNIGKGKFIVVAPPLDDLSGHGYSRFPTMANAISRILDCRPPFQRQAVDAYFDPGYRSPAMPIDSLARCWKGWGIRAVHASAWYYGDERPYAYKDLIDAAHRHGILVYLWLEWPHVGQGFWNRHPDWREKTATLQDAKLDWLHLMDLQNPECMRAALGDLSRQLALDWDGIDIAEFTITGAGGEALEGPSNPAGFTSFGPTMRREFKDVAGFDPLELENPSSEHFWKRDSTGLDKFYEYRKVVNNRLLRRVVEFIVHQEKKENRDWELIHTIVDNSLHPEFDRLFGFDIDTTLALLKEYGITLNVEDPYMEWDQPPVRYRRLRETLASLIPERPSMIDINVVPIHDEMQHGFASAQATGSEFLQQLQMASEQHGRVCVYSESSVFDRDWPLVPYAMAAGSEIRKNAEGWDVKVPATVQLNIAGYETVLKDGKPWPCYGPEGIILPPGSHRISFLQKSSGNDVVLPELRLFAMTGELVDCEVSAGGFEVTYTAPSRCLISLSAPPERILIDGTAASVPALKERDVCILLAPSGKHRLSLAVAKQASH